MRLEELLLEVAFSAKNFPETGNENFSGAGERTDYVNGKENKKDGFPLAKDVHLIKPKPGLDKLFKDNKVFITVPGQLYRGAEIGAPNKKGVYTKVGLLSSKKKDSIGYLMISSITKPSGASQARVGTGSKSQDIIRDQLKDEYGSDYEFISSAAPGSTKPDLVVRVDNQEIQFEIKGQSSSTAPITFFDKSVRRGQTVELLDELAQTFSNNKFKTFTKLIDFYRKKDKTIGFPGDEGVVKSGKLPPELTIEDDRRLLNKLRITILRHFKNGGDNYFAIHNRTHDEVKIYHTKFGSNPLSEDPVPTFQRFSLQTYGGPSGGAMRVGLKIKLHS